MPIKGDRAITRKMRQLGFRLEATDNGPYVRAGDLRHLAAASVI